MKQHPQRFLDLVDKARTQINEVSITDINAILEQNKSCQLIDVREDHEWMQSRIPGATHIGKGVIECKIESIFPDLKTELYLYCGGGYRSALAAKALMDMGYQNVYSIKGGFREWCMQGLPVDNN
jgi:rhodanese-related sulfurtransferase